MPRIVVCAASTQAAHRAHAAMWAERLALACVDSEHDEVAQTADALLYAGEALSLQDLGHPGTNPVKIDFAQLHVRINLLHKQPIIRALGRQQASVIDATAGLGQDAFLMAAAGWQVEAIERVPVLAALLEDAICRMGDDAGLAAMIDGRLSVCSADSCEVLDSLDLDTAPEVIYLDPMYPEKRRRSALPRKEMVLVRRLVGDDVDAEVLFSKARAKAHKRVVVKRPHYAPPLAGRPDFEIAGKLVRYDVYLNHEGSGCE